MFQLKYLYRAPAYDCVRKMVEYTVHKVTIDLDIFVEMSLDFILASLLSVYVLRGLTNLLCIRARVCIV